MLEKNRKGLSVSKIVPKDIKKPNENLKSLSLNNFNVDIIALKYHVIISVLFFKLNTSNESINAYYKKSCILKAFFFLSTNS